MLHNRCTIAFMIFFLLTLRHQTWIWWPHKYSKLICQILDGPKLMRNESNDPYPWLLLLSLCRPGPHNEEGIYLISVCVPATGLGELIFAGPIQPNFRCSFSQVVGCRYGLWTDFVDLGLAGLLMLSRKLPLTSFHNNGYLRFF